MVFTRSVIWKRADSFFTKFKSYFLKYELNKWTLSIEWSFFSFPTPVIQLKSNNFIIVIKINKNDSKPKDLVWIIGLNLTAKLVKKN